MAKMPVEATAYIDLVERFSRLVTREVEGVRCACEPSISAERLEVRLRQACDHAIDALLYHGHVDRVRIK